MKTNQPKYITYRGAKYERIPTLNEIRVDPTPPNHCCLIRWEASGQDGDYPVYFKNEPPKKVAEDFLQDYISNLDAEDVEYLLNGGIISDSPIRVDQYSYHGKLHEEGDFIVCSQGRGAYRHIYDLAKKWVDLKEGDPANFEEIDEAWWDLEDALNDLGLN